MGKNMRYVPDRISFLFGLSNLTFGSCHFSPSVIIHAFFQSYLRHLPLSISLTFSFSSFLLIPIHILIQAEVEVEVEIVQVDVRVKDEPRYA